MDEQEEALKIRRILVALDASHHSLAALRAAAELAGSLEAEVAGLFVEDVNLMRAAGLPMARELRFPFARHAQMTPQRMKRQLRAQALQARHAISSMCEQQGIEWTFEVVRGRVSSRLLEEAAKADMLCVGRASRPVMQGPRTGSTARAAAARAQQSVLVISQGVRIQAPVVATYDGSPEADQALLLARRLAIETGGFLSILVPAGPSMSPEELQERLADSLEGKDVVVRYRELAGSGVMSIIRGVHSEGCGTLVVSRASLSEDEISKLLDGVECPVVLTR
jgi:nucleotide-binding universal stress UspA family protein